MATRAAKEATVDALAAKLRASPLSVVAGFSGLRVKDLETLRREFLASGSSVRVVKNSLARRAATASGVEGLAPMLTQQTLLAFSGDDPAATAKTLRTFSQRVTGLTVRGAAFEGRIIDALRVNRIATLPGREQLRAELVWTLNSPITGLVYALDGTLSSLVYALQGRLDQLKAAAA